MAFSLSSSLQMPNAFNQRYHVYRCSCGQFKRGTEMKKHRAAKNKVEPGLHDTVWSSLVCSLCHASASIGNESFLKGHARCEPQESTAKKSFTTWLDDLSRLSVPKEASKSSDRQLEEDLHLSSDDDDDDFTKAPTPTMPAKSEQDTKPSPQLPSSSNQPHEVDLDLEAAFSPEMVAEWDIAQTHPSETERAVATILPPPPSLAPALDTLTPEEGPSCPPTLLEKTPSAAQAVPKSKPSVVPLLPEKTPSLTQAAPKSHPSEAISYPSPTPTDSSLPPTPKPRSRKRITTSPLTVRTAKGIKLQSALRDQDNYKARVSQREAQLALLDRYNNARTAVKRLTEEKEVAEEKAAAIQTIKEENCRLRTQRGHDVEALAKLTAEKAHLSSRLEFTNTVNRELEEEVRRLKAENERLRRTRPQTERHTLHVPCVCGVIVSKPEVNEDGSPLSICFENEANGVICHHISLQRTEGKLSATPLTVQKRKIPTEVIESAKRMSR